VTSAPRSFTALRAIAFVWLGLLGGFAIGVEWIRSRPEPPRPSGGIDLVGAGATFPYPLYRRWFADYGAASGVRINYFSVGSIEGIRLMLDGAADFGAADRPLLPDERARAICGPMEIPTVLGAVAVAYRVPGLTTPLRLDADVLAQIFLGTVTEWNAPAIQSLNPGIALPALAIHPVQRARTTGTSAVFAQYLSASPRWRDAQRDGRELVTPGSRVEGNEGVTAEISAREGAVGVVELTYAQQVGLAVAALRNRAGEFVEPTPASITVAAEQVLTPESVDTIAGVVDARAGGAYPAVVLTRIIADQALSDTTRAAHFIAFARWALRDGARSATEVGYAPLPEAIAARQLRRLDALRPGRCPTPRSAP
jgi:phosphate transport system substrate-binding protein